MSDRNDFDFEDDFLSDDNEPFDFDDEEGFPSGLGDEFESDMPEIEEEPEERGGNRTFVVLAGIMIILFVAALAVVLFLATRETGPTDTELTITAVVIGNLTVEAQMAQTSTQNAADFFLTQTAAAWTPTPSPTLEPSATLSPTPTEERATITPTPSPNLTELALLQLGVNALTQTALAELATDTPSPTQPSSVGLDLQSAFATQVAYATLEGAFDQAAFETRAAAATQIANASIDTQGELNLREQLNATQSAVRSHFDAVQTAIAFIDNELQVRSVDNPALATNLAIVIPAGLQTQAALGTPFAQATVAAIQTQSALGTLSADVGAYAPGPSMYSKPGVPDQSRAELATEVALIPEALLQQNETATAAVIATRDSFVTQAALATRGAIATQAALATQQAFLTPRVYATQAAIATQVALATRRALIDQALGLVATSTPGGGGIDAVNQTATAIAAAFLTATAQAFTPEALTITALPPTVPFGQAATALPETGLFDDVVGGGRSGLGVLALAIFGLVGVIVVSRRLRGANSRAEALIAQPMPEQQAQPPQPEPQEPPQQE